MSKKQSKLSGIVATVGAVALMASMAAPVFASSTIGWSRNLNPLSAETHITSGQISKNGAGTYSVWIDSIQFGKAYFWVAGSNGSPIGYNTILPKDNGGTSTTLRYFARQSQGATVNLRGKSATGSVSFNYVTGRVNFG
ncbi:MULTISPECIES: hypothetical protein [Caproicibacterium]|uniref:Uncharacterized protein n=1 Tax=Caproicibacterium argilliputei TaxID=3030016 RepID=A0AA97DAK9_9FIRM|nr:hypothetical protein [Caproicibacterium argilliputei]WOC33371.1 hypothetical protein PXC00_05750 [Caproicibacterium argilliputei]